MSHSTGSHNGDADVDSTLSRGLKAIEAGAQFAKERARTAVDKAEEVYDDTREMVSQVSMKRAERLASDTAKAMKRHPGTSMLVAGAAGFLLGALLSRRR
jgi:ElaB/YqjD/DUF883 family membrane-anchored ribosome-binding protein